MNTSHSAPSLPLLRPVAWLVVAVAGIAAFAAAGHGLGAPQADVAAPQFDTVVWLGLTLLGAGLARRTATGVFRRTAELRRGFDHRMVTNGRPLRPIAVGMTIVLAFVGALGVVATAGWADQVKHGGKATAQVPFSPAPTVDKDHNLSTERPA